MYDIDDEGMSSQKFKRLAKLSESRRSIRKQCTLACIAMSSDNSTDQKHTDPREEWHIIAHEHTVGSGDTERDQKSSCNL